MRALPTGTVVFLFTDIEDSTNIARRHPENWERLQARHDALHRAESQVTPILAVHGLCFAGVDAHAYTEHGFIPRLGGMILLGIGIRVVFTHLSA